MIDVFHTGPGPFVTPRLERFVSLEMNTSETCMARFRFEDGAELLLPIHYPAALQFEHAIRIWLARNAPTGGAAQ